MGYAMKMVGWQLALRCTLFLVLVTGSVAKRIPPKPVNPVVSDGIRYSAEGDGRDQYIFARDSSNNKVLWKVRVFHNHVKFWMEEDVQWIYITDLKLSNNLLLVRDERSRCYSVNLKKRRVRRCDCDGLFLR